MEAVQTTSDASEIRELESQLAAMISQSASDIAHNESLDYEQRAEIYAILQALQNDSQSDCQLANVVVTAIAQEAGVLEEALLAEQFQSLLEKERQAACAYAGLAAKVSDPQLKLKIEQLCRDKQKHIRLAQRLLEIVE